MRGRALITLLALGLGACSESSSSAPTSPPDGGAPPELFITVNDIPAEMNGSGTFANNLGRETPYRLLLPRWDFEINARLREGVAAIDPESLTLRCTAEDVAEGALGPCDGRNLADRLLEGTRWLVAEEDAMPVSDALRLSLSVRDVEGRSSETALVVATTERTAELDPFDRPERWLLTFDRDLYTIDAGYDATNQYLLRATAGGNGIADFDEELVALGLQGEDSADGAARFTRDGITGVNAVFRHLLLEGLRENLDAYFEDVPIEIFFAGDPGAPRPEDFATDGDFSILAFGGDSIREDARFGAAQIDDYNQSQQRNDTARLGIFTAAVARLLGTNSFSADIVRQFAPPLGTPIGTHVADPRILAADYDRGAETDNLVRSRASALSTILSLAPLGLAALTAHEICHSLGLVPPGPPPVGFFGGTSAAQFTVGVSTERHIDTEGFNIMQSGNALELDPSVLILTPHFNPLNQAYLRRRLLYDKSRTPLE